MGNLSKARWKLLAVCFGLAAAWDAFLLLIVDASFDSRARLAGFLGQPIRHWPGHRWLNAPHGLGLRLMRLLGLRLHAVPDRDALIIVLSTLVAWLFWTALLYAVFELWRQTRAASPEPQPAQPA